MDVGPVIMRVVPSAPFVMNIRLVPMNVLFGFAALFVFPVNNDVSVDFAFAAIFDEDGITTLLTIFSCPSACVTKNIH